MGKVKDEIAEAIGQALTKYEGYHDKDDMPEVLAEIKEEVAGILTARGVCAKKLNVRLAEDGYIEIDAGDYVKIEELN